MTTFSTIICSINLTENNMDIVDYTKKFAKMDNAKIILLHFAPSLDRVAHFMTYNSALDDVIKDSSKRMEKYLTDFTKENFDGYDVEMLIKAGPPPRVMLELVDKYCADLVVMGSISTKEWYSFLFSNASDKFISETRVPVIVVPNDLSLECLPIDDEIHLKQENPW